MFLTAIETPGMTAPDESCTTPEIVAVVTWAETRWPPAKIIPINSTGKYRDMFPPGGVALASPMLLFAKKRVGLNEGFVRPWPVFITHLCAEDIRVVQGLRYGLSYAPFSQLVNRREPS